MVIIEMESLGIVGNAEYSFCELYKHYRWAIDAQTKMTKAKEKSKAEKTKRAEILIRMLKFLSCFYN